MLAHAVATQRWITSSGFAAVVRDLLVGGRRGGRAPEAGPTSYGGPTHPPARLPASPGRP